MTHVIDTYVIFLFEFLKLFQKSIKKKKNQQKEKKRKGIQVLFGIFIWLLNEWAYKFTFLLIFLISQEEEFGIASIILEMTEKKSFNLDNDKECWITKITT